MLTYHRYANTFVANLVSRAFLDSPDHSSATTGPISFALQNTTSNTGTTSRTRDAVNIEVDAVESGYVSSATSEHGSRKTPAGLVGAQLPLIVKHILEHLIRDRYQTTRNSARGSMLACGIAVYAILVPSRPCSRWRIYAYNLSDDPSNRYPHQ